jgi:uncharacterized protein
VRVLLDECIDWRLGLELVPHEVKTARQIELAWAAMLGFVRITTNRRVAACPLPVQHVMEQLQAWLALPRVHIAHPSHTHFARLQAELEHLGTAGNLTTDAHLAVLAMERGYVLYSTDTDFARFSALRWVNPCKEA